MSDAGTLAANSVDLTTGTTDIDTESPPKTMPFPEEPVGRVGILQPDASLLEIDETNPDPRQQYEVLRSSEEVDDTTAVPTMRPSSPSSLSSTRSSASSPPTTPSSSKSLDEAVPLEHSSAIVAEEATDEEHTFVVGQNNDVPTSPLPSFDVLEDVETSTATTSPASSTSSLPQVTCGVPTSTSVITIQGTGLNHESYGLLSLLRPRTDSSNGLSVRFAPLPELAPRKRKSTIPLGMAARSQLARKRRMYQEAHEHEDRDPYRPRLYAHVDPHPERKSAEVDNAELRVLKKKMLEKLRKEEEEEELVEDSLVVLAKKMGSAGKHLWKKMMAPKASKEDTSSSDEQQAALSGVTDGKPASRAVDPVILPPLSEKDEEKTDHSDEKPQVRKGTKLLFRTPQAPTLSS